MVDNGVPNAEPAVAIGSVVLEPKGGADLVAPNDWIELVAPKFSAGPVAGKPPETETGGGVVAPNKNAFDT